MKAGVRSGLKTHAFQIALNSSDRRARKRLTLSKFTDTVTVTLLLKGTQSPVKDRLEPIMKRWLLSHGSRTGMGA